MFLLIETLLESFHGQVSTLESNCCPVLHLFYSGLLNAFSCFSPLCNNSTHNTAKRVRRLRPLLSKRTPKCRILRFLTFLALRQCLRLVNQFCLQLHFRPLVFHCYSRSYTLNFHLESANHTLFRSWTPRSSLNHLSNCLLNYC